MSNLKRKKYIKLDGKNLSIEDVINIAEYGYKVNFTFEVWQKIKYFRKALEAQLYENPETHIYGVTRGCGDLISSILKKKEWENYIKAYKKYKRDHPNRKRAFQKYLKALEDYQTRYILAHNCGTGKPLPSKIVRAVMAIRLNSFARGASAVRPETCKLTIDMLNKEVTPWVLEEGSVGASGDLIPLAMIGAVLLGLPKAKAYYKDKLFSAPLALKKAGLKKIKLGAKEAMALTNGSTLITALSLFAVRDGENILNNASISTALSLEAIRGEKDAFSLDIIKERKHKGTEYISKQIRNLIEDSKRTEKNSQCIPFPEQLDGTATERIQDRYSFRAVPPVHGAVYEAIQKLREVVNIEINSATDNPLLFKYKRNYRAKSGANFHGQPLAVVNDYVKLALTSLALISDKRTFSMLDKHQSYGLPAELAVSPSKGDTGLMLAQYAGAARAAESRVLSTPASIMSISTSANQEDFVSMGTFGALHLHKVIYNTQIVIAIEILCALRAIQMTYRVLPESLRKLGRGTNRVYENLNKTLPKVDRDRYIKTDIDEVIKRVKSGELVKLVNEML